MRSTGFTVWVTGPDPATVGAVAEEIAARLAARRIAVDCLDARTPGIETLGGDGVECRVACIAGALARHGVATVVSLGPAAGAARAALDRMVEIYVRPLGAPSEGYAPPERPEVEIAVPESGVGAGAERTLRTLEVLQLLERGAGSAYSEDEEREVIRRLKAFGYL